MFQDPAFLTTRPASSAKETFPRNMIASTCRKNVQFYKYVSWVLSHFSHSVFLLAALLVTFHPLEYAQIVFKIYITHLFQEDFLNHLKHLLHEKTLYFTLIHFYQFHILNVLNLWWLFYISKLFKEIWITSISGKPQILSLKLLVFSLTPWAFVVKCLICVI